jgi:GNAT superfamily N-acetyltransferase
MATGWILRDSRADDAPWMAELRALVMRDDLERLGRYDSVRVRRRFLDAFEPARTRVIVVRGTDVGLIAVRFAEDCRWIEHFYLRTDHQGRGIGSAVLGYVLGEHADDERPFRLNVLRGSRAQALYEAHGFLVDDEDPIDVVMVAHTRKKAPSSSTPSGVRGM